MGWNEINGVLLSDLNVRQRVENSESSQLIAIQDPTTRLLGQGPGAQAYLGGYGACFAVDASFLVRDLNNYKSSMGFEKFKREPGNSILAHLTANYPQ
jgi:hypothetical protein